MDLPEEFVSTAIAKSNIKDGKKSTGIGLYNAHMADLIKLKLVILVERESNGFQIVNDHIMLSEISLNLSHVLHRQNEVIDVSMDKLALNR